MHIPRARLWRTVAGLAVLTLVAAACGGGGGGGGGKAGVVTPSGYNLVSATSSKVIGGSPSKGGTLTVAANSDIDHMDPAAAYTVIYWNTVGRGTVRTLTTYKNGPDLNAQSSLVPDIATSLGQHNANDTVWTYHLKSGIDYGPALGGVKVPGVTGKPVTSYDIKYAIERTLLPSTGAGYPFYFTPIKGATAFQNANKNGGPIKGQVKGIVTPNARTIVFHLTQPIGDWDYRMALPATSPVPERYAKPMDEKSTSTYGQHVLATGPYYVSQYTPNQLIVMKRNPYWKASTDSVRHAYVNEFRMNEGFSNSVCNEKVMNGSYDVAAEDCVLSGAQLRKALTTPSIRSRTFVGPIPCTGYMFLNTQVKPFDNLKVREAVNYAIDKRNLLRLTGGPSAGTIAASVLPPGMIGYVPPSKFDPYTHNVAKAKALMKQAGYPNGFKGKLLMVGNSQPPTPQEFQSIQEDLKKIGISNFEVKTLPYPAYYTNYLEIPAKHVATGLAGWCEDFPSPTSFMTPLLYGPSILKQGNSNYSMANYPPLNKLIREASAATGSRATQLWTKANELATKQAFWVPTRWENAQVLVSPKVSGAYFDTYYEWIDWVNVGVK